MSDQDVDNDETVFRRVPSSAPWFEPPDHVTTANFKLNKRRNELGLSVYRESIVTADEVLNMADATPGSFLLRANVGEIRKLKNGAGDDLNLDVIAVDDEDNPGHSEIRGSTPGKLTNAQSTALRNLFVRVDD